MSILNLNSKALFIHVPKTAGSSIEAHDFLSGGGHQPIRFYRRFVQLSSRGLEWDSFFKFGFVRNPYTRFASATTAHYMGVGQQNEVPENRGKYELNKEDFLRFLREYIEPIKGDLMGETDPQKHIHLQPMYKFLTIYKQEDFSLGWEDKIEVDYVGRFENLTDDWKEVCDSIGVECEPLNHIRKNSFQDYESLWTPEAREIVNEIYAKDFEIFEYEKTNS